ncbi:MAG: prepilin-type N-terminal cleavage/methylation domain-containing protein, partial [Woeseiaceae bacterium]|nr:prepilin-type N-terminal cleavage/methylation domain-containing protein [Woeseiaceae bacterium]
MTPARTSMRGFTLLEVVVAVAIFAILSVLAYRSLAGTFENIDRLNDRMERIQAVQRSMRIIGRDFMQA